MAGVGLRALRLATRLGWAGGVGLVRLTLARRRAVAGFGKGLAEAGLPPEVVGPLKAAYPSLNVRELMRRRKGREEASGLGAELGSASPPHGKGG